MNSNNFNRLNLLAAALAAATTAGAQTAPNAGSVLRDLATPALAPRTSQELRIELPSAMQALPGGGQATLESVSFTGNALFSQEQLQALLGEVKGQSLDLAGVRALAERISAHYRQAGYPFARAYVPQQALQGGALRIEVIEGRYGQIQAKGETALNAQAQPFLDFALKSGNLIETKALERATLILADQSGIKALPTIRPGQAVGTGDLDVQIVRTQPYTWDAGLDNQGNRYTGRTRAHLYLNADSPFVLGDQVTLRSLVTEQGMWFGNVGYARPVGASGLRAQLGYSHTYYELGQDFANLQASGTADVTSLGLSYPLLRSQQANVSLSATLQHKSLKDVQGAASTDTSKSSDSLPVGVNFDKRDTWGGGGISYGNLTWTFGNLSLDGKLATTDSKTAQSAGSFSKLALDLARIQTLTNELSLFVHVSAQWANKNLDSSERLSLGGATGVRAYPVGEGSGDDGYLAQIELRYSTALASGMTLSPYLFVDSGSVKINHAPWDASVNERSIGGAGLGVRGNYKAMSFDASLAWRTNGGDPVSDTQRDSPMLWLTVGWKF